MLLFYRTKLIVLLIYLQWNCAAYFNNNNCILARAIKSEQRFPRQSV